MTDWRAATTAPVASAASSAASPLLPATTSTFGVGGGMIGTVAAADEHHLDGCILLGAGDGEEREVLGLEAAALPASEASENQCLLSEELYRLSGLRRVWKKEALELWALKDDAGYVLESRASGFARHFQRARVRACWTGAEGAPATVSELASSATTSIPSGRLRDRLVFAVRFFADADSPTAGSTESPIGGGSGAKWQRFRAVSVHQMYRWMLVLRRLFPDPACPDPRPGLDFVAQSNEVMLDWGSNALDIVSVCNVSPLCNVNMALD